MVTVAIFPQIHYPIGEPIYNMTSGAVDGQALMAKKRRAESGGRERSGLVGLGQGAKEGTRRIS